MKKQEERKLKRPLKDYSKSSRWKREAGRDCGYFFCKSLPFGQTESKEISPHSSPFLKVTEDLGSPSSKRTLLLKVIVLFLSCEETSIPPLLLKLS